VIRDRLGDTKMLIRDLSSLIGLMLHLSQVVPGLKAAAAHLFKVLGLAKKNRWKWVRNSNFIRAPLRLSLFFIDNWSGSSFIFDEDWTDGPTKLISQDACIIWGRGAWCAISLRYYFEAWPLSILALAMRQKMASASFLELFGNVEAVVTLCVRGDRALVKNDCLGMVTVGNSRYSKNPHILSLLHFLDIWCANNGVLVKFVHLSAEENWVADALSRNQFQIVAHFLKNFSRTHPNGVTPLWL
jgi:hypothetical protein